MNDTIGVGMTAGGISGSGLRSGGRGFAFTTGFAAGVSAGLASGPALSLASTFSGALLALATGAPRPPAGAPLEERAASVTAFDGVLTTAGFGLEVAALTVFVGAFAELCAGAFPDREEVLSTEVVLLGVAAFEPDLTLLVRLVVAMTSGILGCPGHAREPQDFTSSSLFSAEWPFSRSS